MDEMTLQFYAVVAIVIAMGARCAVVIAETFLHQTTPERSQALAASGRRGARTVMQVIAAAGWDRRVAACRTALHGFEAAGCAVLGVEVSGRGGMIAAVLLHLAVAAGVENRARSAAVAHPDRFLVLAAVVGKLLLPGRAQQPGEGNRERSSEPGENDIETEALRNVVDTARREDVIDPTEHRLITAVMGLGTRKARDVMVPKVDVVCVEAGSSVREAYDVMLEARVSRAPIVRRDDVAVVHLKDVARAALADSARPVLEVAREALVVPETRSVRSLLHEMQTTRRHLAAVADEYGEFTGIVTLEDCIEELLGEIEDEHDDLRAPTAVADGEGRWRVHGGERVRDVNTATGCDLPEGDADTVGGLVFETLGRSPETGDAVLIGEWMLTVTETAGRRVVAVVLERV